MGNYSTYQCGNTIIQMDTSTELGFQAFRNALKANQQYQKIKNHLKQGVK